ncbi:WD40 repeat domain-containing protein [Streptosporangium carneum]|uniref:WD40 repeat domain-containing protein n=1 Tax=Streptosporangium carneum TaxID=47481 RepID=A0A9W6I6E6_9ACTN|nr:WD40 repeat domain-containing protein [Streptosporangium carneum]GLK12089.1 hypothetical protein GCM10017600_54970 [Streptosporangium carneum]
MSVTLAALLAVALAAGALAVQQSRAVGERNVTIALQRDRAEARQLAATADALRVAEPVTAMLLSVAAWRLASAGEAGTSLTDPLALAAVTEARASLTGSLAQRETASFHDPATDVRTFRALSRDGRTLVSASDGEARIWDVRTGRRASGFTGIGDDLTGIALSPSGRRLAVVSRTKLTIWDVAKGRPTGATLTVPEGGDGGWSQPFFGQAEDLVLVRLGEGLTVWNSETGGEAFPFSAGMDFDTSPDGRGLVTAGLDGNVTAWTLKDRGKVRLDHCESCALRAAYSPDNRTVAVRNGALVRLRDASTGADLQRSFTGADTQRAFDEGDADTLRFSPDGRFLASVTGKSIRIWRVEDGALLLTHAIDAFSPVAAFDPDGRTLRYLSEGSVTTLDIAAVTMPVVLKDAETHRAALSPDGRLLASKGERTSEVRLWDVRRRKPVATLDVGLEDLGGYFEMAFSGDGGRLAVISGTGNGVAIWDTRTFRRIAAVEASTQGYVSAVAMSPDGAVVACYVAPSDTSGGKKGEIHAWDVPSGRHRWSRKQVYPEGLRFTPDGRALAIVGDEQRLLDAETGKPFGPSYGSPTVGVSVTGLAFSEDGSRFVISDEVERLSIWETGSRRPVGGIIRGGSDIAAPLLAYSPRGDVIASRTDARSVALWDVATGRRLGAPIAVGAGEPKSLAFTADGSRLVTVDSEGALTEHPVDTEVVVTAVCERAGRTLTRQEWETYLKDIPYRNVCPD